MGLDIGLKPAMRRIRIDNRARMEALIRRQWVIDLVTTYMLEGMSPVLDANMMRIYAAAYKKNTTGLNDEKLCNLATSYQAGIKFFVYQNLFNKINSIVLRWESLVRSVPEGESFFSIPTNSLTMFNNLLTFHKLDDSANDTLQFNALKSSLTNNSVEWYQAWFEDFDISKYILPKERFLEYINIVKSKIAYCYQKSNASDSVAVDYQTKINSVLDYIKVLLLIVHQVQIDSREDAKKYAMDDIMFKHQISPELTKQANLYASKYAGILKMVHIACLDTKEEISLPAPTLNEMNASTIATTDEYQFLYVTYLRDHLGTEEE